MAHMFVLVWPLLLVWWCGFLLMGSFAGCLLFDTGDDLLEPFGWLNQSEKPRQEQRPWKGKGSLQFIAYFIVSYCFILFHIVWISQDIGDPCGLSMSHWSRSLHHFAFPWVVKMWNSSWISSQRDSAGVGSGSCALNSSWILGPYPPTVIVSWQILSCCTETFLQHLESGATGIIRTWPKRNCQRSSANFDDLIRTQ